MPHANLITPSPLLNVRSDSSSTTSIPKMNFLRKLSKKGSDKQPQTTSFITRPVDMSIPQRTTPTRRPQMEVPPSYEDTIKSRPRAESESGSTISATSTSTKDSPFAFLKQFDTIFLVDDSGSMAGRGWRETSAALSAITPTCTEHDADGIDIFFLNHRNRRVNSGLAQGGYTNVNSTSKVHDIFSTVRPMGGTPTGARLNQILKPYLAQLETAMQRNLDIKPINIIVITDGVPSDDVESVIVAAAKKLDKLEAVPWQIGIQFFQVGEEPEAAEDLKDLDDALSGQHEVRDIVDTVPWNGQTGPLSADMILKVTMGSINRRLDRKSV